MCLETARIVAFPDDRGLVAARREMAVDAIGADVERAVLVPADMEILGVVGDVLDLGVGLDPVEALALLAPEGDGIGDRGLVEIAIFGIVDIGALGPFGRRRG